MSEMDLDDPLCTDEKELCFPLQISLQSLTVVAIIWLPLSLVYDTFLLGCGKLIICFSVIFLWKSVRASEILFYFNF